MRRLLPSFKPYFEECSSPLRLTPLLTLTACMLVLFGCASPREPNMTAESLSRQLAALSTSSQVSDISANSTAIEYDGVAIQCIWDELYDRMRLVSAVARADSLAPAHLETILVANFHTTLDARYGLSDGIVYAAFLHPLAALTGEQLESAVRQVAALVKNFGTTFSSDELMFGGDRCESI